MNGIMFSTGMIFLIFGMIGVLYMPVIVHGFYEYTGLDNLQIYQNEEVISDVIYSNWLASIVATIGGLGMIIGSKL